MNKTMAGVVLVGVYMIKATAAMGKMPWYSFFLPSICTKAGRQFVTDCCYALEDAGKAADKVEATLNNL
jgi:hypothetical protein